MQIVDRLSTWLQEQAVLMDPVCFWRTQAKIRLLEPELALVPLLCKRGSVMVDVGLHTGMYMATALPYVQAAIGFEARLSQAARMKRAFAKYPATVHAVALSNSAGTAEFRVPRHRPTRATLAATNELSDLSATIDRIEVQLCTLDSFRLSDVCLIKIDTEGNELAVLQGALDTIERCRPSFVIEAEDRHRPNAVEDIQNILRPFGYAGFFLRHGAVEDVRGFDAKRDQAADSSSPSIRNFVFVQPNQVERLHSYNNMQRK